MKKYSTEEVLKLAEVLSQSPTCVRDMRIADALQDLYYLGVNDGIDRLSETLQKRNAEYYSNKRKT